MRKQSILVLAMAVLLFGLASISFATTASFQGISNLQGKTSGEAKGVSADGSVAVGYCWSSDEAFRWTESSGTQSIGEGRAYGVSGDGSVVVGYNSGGAYRWTQSEGMTNLGSLPSKPSSYADAVSDDGLVVVGGSHNWPTYTGEAFRWTESTGMVGLGDLPGGSNKSHALGVSADGSVIVGYSYSDASGGVAEAFRWTESTGMVGLGDLQGGGFESSAWDVSSDGSVIVGFSYTPTDAEAFRWTESGGMQGLGYGHAFGVSADGSIVVGIGLREAIFGEAFIWNVDRGMRSIKDVLENECGLDLTGWTLTMATGISDDGLTIVGYGYNPDGNRQPWIATVPEPPDLNTGLVAYYPFNGNANDETGNGHNGTVYGAALTTDRFGCSDSAYSFDGIDDYIEAGNPADFGFTNESFSVSVWAYVIENRPVYESFVGLGSTDRQYCVNKWRFGDAFYTEFDHGPSQVSFYPDGGLQPDTWYHLVSVVNMESGYMEFYGDGVLRGTNNLIPFDFSSDTVLRFGMRPYIGNYLLGLVDDVRIYNRALSSNEVELLYSIQELCPSPPDANANGPYIVYVGDTLVLDANGSTDDNNDIVSYMWDLDNNNSFETDAGTEPIFDVNYTYLQSLGLLVNHTYTIHLKVTDSENQSDTADTTLTIVPKPALVVTVDIKPTSCPNPVNVKSSGVLPIAILGTDDYDVTTIDPTSVRLAGVEPLRSGYEDVAAPVSDSNDCNCIEAGPDGVLELTLKFETQEIVKAIGDVNDGDILTLQLTGILYDPIPFETPIEGADCILIKGKYKAHNKADINKDGVVNYADFALLAENWLRSSIVED